MKMSTRSTLQGHAAALFTVLVWGCTFVSSKILLTEFNSIEILFMRFVLGFLILLLIPRRVPRPLSLRFELIFAGAALSGVTLYYLLENLALTHTLAANVSVITCAAPFFTALFAHWFLKEETLTPLFFLGFVVSIAGICLLSFYGSTISLDPLGLLFAFGASVCWGCYSVLCKKATESGFNTVAMTQRFFFYALVFMLPLLKFLDFAPNLSLLAQPKFLLNLLFLGVIASAACFLTWNFALARLGTVEASVYIYLIPVVTVIASMLVLKEDINGIGFIGILLTLAGLIVSEFKPGKA